MEPETGADARACADAVWKLPAVRDWRAAAEREPETHPAYDL